jgi:hypothetical protein
MLLLHPDGELVVDVGDELARADAARRLIDRLASATPQPVVSRGADGTGDGGTR